MELRADAGFAVPAIYEYREAEGIDYTIEPSSPTRASKNWRLPCLDEPKSATRKTGERSDSSQKVATKRAAGIENGG
jgi:hypothetical protein